MRQPGLVDDHSIARPERAAQPVDLNFSWGALLQYVDAISYLGIIGNRLPALEWLAKPLYRRAFGRPYNGNAYYGLYQSYSEAEAAAPPTMLHSYDQPAASLKYQHDFQDIRASDYPVVYWLSRLFKDGQGKVFDLGGHLGQAYYGFAHYLEYPHALEWRVQDVPAVVEAGRQRALKDDPERRLGFTTDFMDAEGSDILVTTGALQYLESTLPEMLQRLASKPKHVLINMVPMHPERNYFTLQNMGIAICPYRVVCVPEFVTSMLALGYEQIVHWKLPERYLKVPFEPSCTIECYHGFYFRRAGS